MEIAQANNINFLLARKQKGKIKKPESCEDQALANTWISS
jgi:hypothetical protein